MWARFDQGLTESHFHLPLGLLLVCASCGKMAAAAAAPAPAYDVYRYAVLQLTFPAAEAAAYAVAAGMTRDAFLEALVPVAVVDVMSWDDLTCEATGELVLGLMARMYDVDPAYWMVHVRTFDDSGASPPGCVAAAYIRQERGHEGELVHTPVLHVHPPPEIPADTPPAECEKLCACDEEEGKEYCPLTILDWTQVVRWTGVCAVQAVEKTATPAAAAAGAAT